MDMRDCTAGFARLDITPPLGVQLGGHYEGHVGNAVADPLYVNAVAFSQGERVAVLLVCDPLAGTPREFYSVEGSLGGALSLNSFGRLLWDVESIATTFYSPTTNAFTIGGTCQVFRYTFDDSGTLVSQEKTDEFTNFLR